jgi:hypothetical protein
LLETFLRKAKNKAPANSTNRVKSPERSCIAYLGATLGIAC